MTITTATWIVVVGSLGGFCTTFAYVPQVVKIWKQGGRDLSYGMLGLYLFGVILWLVYGLLVHAQAVVLTNFATAILIGIATGAEGVDSEEGRGQTGVGWGGGGTQLKICVAVRKTALSG